MVFPVAYSPMMAPMTASGIDMVAISVMRQSPKNNRIMMETSTAPTIPSNTSEPKAERTATV